MRQHTHTVRSDIGRQRAERTGRRAAHRRLSVGPPAALASRTDRLSVQHDHFRDVSLCLCDCRCCVRLVRVGRQNATDILVTGQACVVCVSLFVLSVAVTILFVRLFL